MSLFISTIIIIHNEEQFVHQCLESVKDISEELIICHDGPCSDRSLEIARRFTNKIFIEDFRGASEPHMVKMIKLAKNDWILEMDCDEVLSPPLIEAIKRLEESEEITHYRAIWKAHWDDERYNVPKKSKAPPSANRLLLYKKSCIQLVGIPNRGPVVKGCGGEILENIEHYAVHQNYSMIQLITKKLLPYARNDARIRVLYPLETYGIPNIENALNLQDRLRYRYPLIVCWPLALLAFYRSLAAVFKVDNWYEFCKYLRWPIPHGLYQLFLGFYIFLYKWQKRKKRC